jgi:hypothetical protein
MLTYAWNVNGEEAHSTFCPRFYGGSPSAEAFGEGGRRGREQHPSRAATGEGARIFFLLASPLEGEAVGARGTRARAD